MLFRTVQMLSNCRIALNNNLRITLGSGLATNFVRSLKISTREKLAQLQIPEKPKRPLTPYVRFTQEQQFKIAKQHPEWKQADIFKKIAQDWKVLHNDSKEHFAKLYKEERERYDKEILQYYGKLTPEQQDALEKAEAEKKRAKEHRKLKKFNREMDKPRKPLIPYMAYLMEQSKMRNIAIKNLMSLLKDEWANMPENEKEKYKIKYEEEKKMYEKELKKWEDKMIELGHLNVVRAKSLKDHKPTWIKQLKEGTFKKV